MCSHSRKDTIVYVQTVASNSWERATIMLAVTLHGLVSLIHIKPSYSACIHPRSCLRSRYRELNVFTYREASKFRYTLPFICVGSSPRPHDMITAHSPMSNYQLEVSIGLPNLRPPPIKTFWKLGLWGRCEVLGSRSYLPVNCTCVRSRVRRLVKVEHSEVTAV
jgi:hypothetical protein